MNLAKRKRWYSKCKENENERQIAKKIKINCFFLRNAQKFCLQYRGIWDQFWSDGRRFGKMHVCIPRPSTEGYYPESELVAEKSIKINYLVLLTIAGSLSIGKKQIIALNSFKSIDFKLTNAEMTLMLIFIICLEVPGYTIVLFDYIVYTYRMDIIYWCHPDDGFPFKSGSSGAFFFM